MDSYDVIANQPVVIDNVSVGIHCFVTVTGPVPVDRAPQRHTVLRAHGHTPIVAVNFHQRWVFFADFSVNSESIFMTFCKHSFKLFRRLL